VNVAPLLMFVALGLSTPALSATFRCEVDGRVTYGDLPCAAGRQSEVAPTRAPRPQDHADALARQKADKASLTAIERQQATDEKTRARIAMAAARGGSDRAKHAEACARLAVRARRAHEDVDLAGPRDQAKARVKEARAAEDYAALCRR
jgi:hypothetical protein